MTKVLGFTLSKGCTHWVPRICKRAESECVVYYGWFILEDGLEIEYPYVMN